MELTPRFLGLDLEKLTSLSLPDQKIVFGWTPRENYLLYKQPYDESSTLSKLVTEIEYEMKLGIKGFSPGFIGEIIINDAKDSFQRVLLKASHQVSQRLGCPLIVSASDQWDELVGLFEGGETEKIVLIMNVIPLH